MKDSFLGKLCHFLDSRSDLSYRCCIQVCRPVSHSPTKLKVLPAAFLGSRSISSVCFLYLISGFLLTTPRPVTRCIHEDPVRLLEHAKNLSLVASHDLVSILVIPSLLASLSISIEFSPVYIRRYYLSCIVHSLSYSQRLAARRRTDIDYGIPLSRLEHHRNKYRSSRPVPKTTPTCTLLCREVRFLLHEGHCRIAFLPSTSKPLSSSLSIKILFHYLEPV